MPASAYELCPRAQAAVSPLCETKKHFLVCRSAVLTYLMKPSMDAVTHIRGLIEVVDEDDEAPPVVLEAPSTMS